MNETVNKFLLAQDKDCQDLMQCATFTKNKERIQKCKKKEIHDILSKRNQIKLIFNMAWLIQTLKIYVKEQLLIKYYLKKHLILLNI